MESPLRGIRFIHKALQHEARAIDDAARDPSSDLTALLDRLAFFVRVTKLHHASEENGLFPELEARRPGVAATLLVDHHEDGPLFEDIARLARTGARQELAVKAAILRETLRLHVKKEEEFLFPLAETLFTPAEQGAHVGKMMASFTPQDFRDVLPWLVRALDDDDRVAYLSMVKRGMPAERFEMVATLLKSQLGDNSWEALAARVG